MMKICTSYLNIFFCTNWCKQWLQLEDDCGCIWCISLNLLDPVWYMEWTYRNSRSCSAAVRLGSRRIQRLRQRESRPSLTAGRETVTKLNYQIRAWESSSSSPPQEQNDSGRKSCLHSPENANTKQAPNKFVFNCLQLLLLRRLTQRHKMAEGHISDFLLFYSYSLSLFTWAMKHISTVSAGTELLI